MAVIYYLGKLADMAGAGHENLSLPPDITNTDALRKWLDTRHRLDGALLHKSIRIAIGDEVIVDSYPVKNSDEIAFLPPVGGG